jgi:hypothetical protein
MTGGGIVAWPPNLYILHNNVTQGGQLPLSIVYSLSGPGEETHFEYHDGGQSLLFSGNEIRTTESPLGNLVTVTITGSTTFTLVVPGVGLAVPGHSSANINTFGVTTTRRGGLFANFGQQELYTVTELAGTAESIVFGT